MARVGEYSPVVSVVVVNFNGGDLVREAVRAVLRSTVPVEVLISDNGSSDKSLPALRIFARNDPRLRLIENERNLGFTRAGNIALARATGDYLLLLNPDCVIEADTLERMLAAMTAHPQAGMAGCLVRDPDGSEQAGCRRAVPTPWRTLVRVFHLDRLFSNHPRFRTFLLNREPLPTQPVFLEAVSGAFMMVRREAMEQVGLLDEHYFLHCEDLDWCMRFRQAGWRILFVPDVEVVHYKGTCSKDRPIRVLYHMHRGMVRFYRKFFQHQYPLPLMGLVVTAVWSRFMMLAVWQLFKRIGGRRQKAADWAEIIPDRTQRTIKQAIPEPPLHYSGPERRTAGRSATHHSVQAR